MKAAITKRLTLCAVLVGVLGLSTEVSAQQPMIPIWPGVAPGSESWTQKETESDSPFVGHVIRNVVRPTLTAYLPDRARATGTAIIVCPGGGFRFHSWQNEGTQVAEWLRDHGVAAFVLKYRLVDTGPTDQDFAKALQALFSGIARLSADKSTNARIGDDLNAMNIIALAAEDGRQ